MVEVFSPASTQAAPQPNYWPHFIAPAQIVQKTSLPLFLYSVITGETTCPQTCSLTMTVILSPVCTAVIWQWIYMWQYVLEVSFTLSIEAESYSEILVPLYQTTWCHIPKDHNLLSICLWLYSPLLDLHHFFSFLIFYTVGRTPWKGDQPFARPLPAHRTVQTQNKRTQTFMPQVGFEPTIPVFERAKTFHALDYLTTVIGYHNLHSHVKLRDAFWKARKPK
jgi:hypothetical protein